jgi:hypothetical protein
MFDEKLTVAAWKTKLQISNHPTHRAVRTILNEAAAGFTVSAS